MLYGVQQVTETGESLELASNIALETAGYSEKQGSQSISPRDAWQIDESDEQCQNARFSIRESLETAWNVTLESAAH
jgi:hypothetical protein